LISFPRHDIRLKADAPHNYGNVQPRVWTGLCIPQGKAWCGGLWLVHGHLITADIMVSWQGSVSFTDMNSHPARICQSGNDLVGLGPSGIVGGSGPFLASQAFANFAPQRRIP